MGRVDPGHGVVAHGLEGKARRLRPERALPLLEVSRHGRDVGVGHVVQGRGEDLDAPDGVGSGWATGSARKSASATAGSVTAREWTPWFDRLELVQGGQVGKPGLPDTGPAPTRPSRARPAPRCRPRRSPVARPRRRRSGSRVRHSPGGSTRGGMRSTSSPYFQPSSTPHVSNWVAAGRTRSAKRAVGVRKWSCTAMNSTRDSSARIRPCG
jgi:hypothetical protein